MEIALNPKNITGLSEKEASAILKEQGYNELPSQKKQSLFSILLNVLKEHQTFCSKHLYFIFCSINSYGDLIPS